MYTMFRRAAIFNPLMACLGRGSSRPSFCFVSPGTHGVSHGLRGRIPQRQEVGGSTEVIACPGNDCGASYWPYEKDELARFANEGGVHDGMKMSRNARLE